jgi:hypothetical protein
MLRWLIFFWACLVIVGLCTIWKAPTNLLRKMSALRAEEEERINASKEQTDRETIPPYELAVLASETFDPSKHATVSEMLFSRQSVILFIVSTCSIFSGLFVVNQTKEFGFLNGLDDDRYLSLIASIGSIFNTLRFVWSWWLDHSRLKIVYATLILMQVFLNFTIFLVDKNWYSYAVWIWLFMFCEGGHFTILPNILFRIFGSRSLAVYGFFGSFVSIVGLIQVFLDDWFLKTTLKSYNMFFVFNGILSVAALVVLWTMFSEKQYIPKSLRV